MSVKHQFLAKQKSERTKEKKLRYKKIQEEKNKVKEEP